MTEIAHPHRQASLVSIIQGRRVGWPENVQEMIQPERRFSQVRRTRGRRENRRGSTGSIFWVRYWARWLDTWAVQEEFGGWDTAMLVRAYGGEEAMEAGARTGCVGCPLITEDRALARVVALPEWAYLAPLGRLRPIYARLQSPVYRLRKPPGERTKTGKMVSKQSRLGPLTMEARRMGLDEVLAVQQDVNAHATAIGRPVIDILNAEEEARIREFWKLGEWPEGWNGDEPVGEDTLMPLFQMEMR